MRTAKRGEIQRAVLAVLADGNWHMLSEVYLAAYPLVSPERAVSQRRRHLRHIHSCRSWMGGERPISLDAEVEMGRKRIIYAAILGMRGTHSIELKGGRSRTSVRIAGVSGRGHGRQGMAGVVRYGGLRSA